MGEHTSSCGLSGKYALEDNDAGIVLGADSDGTVAFFDGDIQAVHVTTMFYGSSDSPSARAESAGAPIGM